MEMKTLHLMCSNVQLISPRVLTNFLSLTPLATKEDWLKPLLAGPLRSITRGWVFTMTFRICFLFCARISIPSMYWTCHSTVTSRKQQKGTTLDLQRCRAARVAQALFQDPLHRVFFGCCTTEGGQTDQLVL